VENFFGNPDLYFYWFDLALAMVIYVLAVVLLLKHKRGYVSPILFFGLFVFPLQFSLWFLYSRLDISSSIRVNLLEIFYLFFVKFCLLLTVIISKK
jgi:hypothetical protein